LESQKSLPIPFLTKTYQLVDDSTIDEVISWTDDEAISWNDPQSLSVFRIPNFGIELGFSSFQFPGKELSCCAFFVRDSGNSVCFGGLLLLLGVVLLLFLRWVSGLRFESLILCWVVFGFLESV
ncbi:Heat stress transcription factor B-2b, partial [Linum perenne]